MCTFTHTHTDKTETDRKRKRDRESDTERDRERKRGVEIQTHRQPQPHTLKCSEYVTVHLTKYKYNKRWSTACTGTCVSSKLTVPGVWGCPVSPWWTSARVPCPSNWWTSMPPLQKGSGSWHTWLHSPHSYRYRWTQTLSSYLHVQMNKYTLLKATCTDEHTLLIDLIVKVYINEYLWGRSDCKSVYHCVSLG